MSSYQDYEPRHHTAASSLAVEAGQGAKGGLRGALQGGLWGSFLGGGIIGLVGGLVASMVVPAFAIPIGIAIGLGSFATPFPYVVGGLMAAGGGAIGVVSGVKQGANRVAHERASERMERAYNEQMAAFHEMAAARGLEAQANMATTQAFMLAQQGGQPMVGQDTARMMPAVQTQSAPEITKAEPNPLLQAGTGKNISASDVAYLGLQAQSQQLAKQ